MKKSLITLITLAGTALATVFASKILIDRKKAMRRLVRSELKKGYEEGWVWRRKNIAVIRIGNLLRLIRLDGGKK